MVTNCCVIFTLHLSCGFAAISSGYNLRSCIVLGAALHGCLLAKSHKQLKLSVLIHTLNHVLVLALIKYSDLSALAIKAQTTLAYSECNIHTVRLLCTVAAAEVDAGTPSAKVHSICDV